MTWIYEVAEASSNPLKILPALTTGMPVTRKILMIEFDHNRRVVSSGIEKSKTHIVGVIGRVNQSNKTPSRLYPANGHRFP